MPGPERLPSGVDVTVPNLARVYDYMLGGKDNFAADRQAADTILSAVPQMRAIALENRRFLIRAVRFCAQAGIRQFIDIGAGLPTQDNVHQIAQRAAPGARVVYADNDGVVVSHGLALLAEDDRTTVIHADLLRPADLLAHPGLSGLIDLTQPVALLIVALLHFVPDDANPLGAVASLRDALAPGSYLVLSGAEFSPEHVVERQPVSEETRRLREAYRRPTGVARSRDEMAAFFGDFELVEPGLTEVWNWRPDSETVINPSDIMTMVGGIARKR